MMLVCNLCDHNEFSIIEEEETPYKVVQCDNCSLVFVHPHPDSMEIKEHYDEGYYSEWLDAQRKRRVRMWSNRLKKLGTIGTRGELLDVGCGEGTFLQLAKKSGWDICGTEISPYAAQYASNISGAEIFCGDLPDAGYHDSTFEVVTMWHVLEHVADPKRYLKEIYRILKPGGFLVLAIPNVNNVIMQITYRIFKGRKLKLFSKDEKEVHLYHFSPETLRAYLDKTGFQCLSVSPDYGIVEWQKKIVNFISVIPYYCAGIHVYNAIEVLAVSKKK